MQRRECVRRVAGQRGGGFVVDHLVAATITVCQQAHRLCRITRGGRKTVRRCAALCLRLLPKPPQNGVDPPQTVGRGIDRIRLGGVVASEAEICLSGLTQV